VVWEKAKKKKKIIEVVNNNRLLKYSTYCDNATKKEEEVYTRFTEK
jgi:hypothetical protein